jgi:hypothetical protein
MVAFASESRQLSQGDLVVVECDHQCSVRLLDDYNFEQFRNGRQHRYYGSSIVRFLHASLFRNLVIGIL